MLGAFDMAIRQCRERLFVLGQCWVKLVPSKHCPASDMATKHFYSFHRVGYLSCSFDRVTQHKSWVGIRITKDESFESLWNIYQTSCSLNVGQNVGTIWHVGWMLVKISGRFDMFTRQYTKLANIWPANVGWMLGETLGPFDTGLNTWNPIGSICVVCSVSNLNF